MMIGIAHTTNRGRVARSAALAGVLFVVAVLAQWASSTSAQATQWTTHLNGSCTQDLQQQADGCPFCNRRHVRIMYADSTYLVGDAHYDDTVWCGGPAHKASTFDGPENDLVTAWRSHGGSANYGWWGNTRHMQQCDGSYTWSSGYPAFMSP